ncbi:unnamed protein product [Penicillium nalgiovense]|nr:unnamed protein product [Penicillium nalgiovense]CAG8147094.1 unnamed protein product [Penicillium nalgiovense]CAG8169781.1 unnamed protein product [Penicillium nalgiovense]CAG8173758.1 unnamed protein product [Penicillium nalgiovense]CAG8191340.1 unnamed protein product [Penicillium nalgiovense]
MSDVSPPQPTELIYWTAPRVFPRQSANIHVAEPRTFDHNTRARGLQLFAVSSSLVLATRTLKHRHRRRVAPRIQHPISAVLL